MKNLLEIGAKLKGVAVGMEERGTGYPTCRGSSGGGENTGFSEI